MWTIRIHYRPWWRLSLRHIPRIHVLSLYYQLLFILRIHVYSALAKHAYFIARDSSADARRITKVPVSFYLNDYRRRFFLKHVWQKKNWVHYYGAVSYVSIKPGHIDRDVGIFVLIFCIKLCMCMYNFKSMVSFWNETL